MLWYSIKDLDTRYRQMIRYISFRHPAIAYKKLGHAKNKADKVARKWLHDKVCVFKVELDERLSCDQYDKWYKDENRLEYETIYQR